MGEIPESSNVFLCVYTELSPAQVAALFGKHAWEFRPCDWTNFEIWSPFAELVIEDSNPILIHGCVADVESRIEQVVQPLVINRIPHEFDCWDGDKLIIERRFMQ
jgi:hypothetical protein